MAQKPGNDETKEQVMNGHSIARRAVWVAMVAFLLGMQSAQARPLVYVPLGGEDRIVVVDAAKDEIIGAIPNIPAVHGLAGTPDGRFLIAGSFSEREAGGAAPEKPAGMTEEEHAAHHGGAAAPAGAHESGSAVSTVSVVRASDGAVVRRIDVPGAVHHVAVSPDGRLAAVTHPNEGGISVIDLGAQQVVATIATGPFPNYAAFSPDSSRVYVSNAGNGTVSAVDTERWIVRWNAATGASPEHLVLSPDGTTLYVNNVEDGTVAVIAVAQEKVVKTILVGATLHGIDLSEDGGTLFVAALADEKVVAVDLASGNARSAPLSPSPYHLAAVRGTGKLYISSAEEPTIWVVDQDSLATHREIRIGGKGHQMVQGTGE